MEILGIDVGGSGIKGAPVNIDTGEMLTERHRIKTPHPATPEVVADVIRQIAEHFNWSGKIGVGFPAVVQNGVVKTAANIDDSWIGTDAAGMISETTKCNTCILNDADAAGTAEMKFGAGKGNKGTVLLITIGTGLGTVIFTRGKLLPNTELGHITMKSVEAEHYTSDAARKRDDLSWEKWGKRFNKYLKYMESLLWPDLIILGGGASKKKKYPKYEETLNTKAKIVPAQMQNNAGIIGAAIAAQDC